MSLVLDLAAELESELADEAARAPRASSVRGQTSRTAQRMSAIFGSKRKRGRVREQWNSWS